jgi:hypothetical protein
MLQYGDEPGADFHTIPQLYYGEERMSLRSEDGKQAIIEGPLLGILRGVEECRCLADYCEKTNPLLPLVALVDGSLILWGLVGQRYDDFVIDRLLVNGFIRQLDRFAAAGADRKLAVASYVSFPRSTDVINLLRVQACPYEPVDCDKNCRGKFADRPCDIVGGLTDRAVFSEVLLPGERSAVFISGSSINDKYGAHQVCFFYLKADEEVSRVELPLWAVDNGGLLTLVHSAVSDQCNKGFGYPVALSEAHEQAVVTGADREQFWNMVERTLADGEVQLRGSLKQRSKKLRWI